MPNKPLILVTNDDGITAPGIRALIEVMSEIGTVIVVAPDTPQSAMDTQSLLIALYRLIKFQKTTTQF
jgi:5'/3'-nucleotidase SurE